MTTLTLREKVEKLITVEQLPCDERKVLRFVLATIEGPLEGLMYPDTHTHVECRFEWYFRPNGDRRL